MFKTPLIATAIAGAALAATSAGSPAARPVDNPWFPLRPGTTFHYKGSEDGVPEVNIVAVTHKTKTIQGVKPVVVHDRVFKHGRVVEDTLDWFAQDAKGNVWYMGEGTKELDAKGHVKSREGSWEAGKNGARKGIIMPAHPKVGMSYRQEFEKGHAEDFGKIVKIKGDRLTTHEWSPLEPGVLDAKFYKRGLGETGETTLKGGHETLSLVRVTHD